MRTWEFDKSGDWTLGMVEGKEELRQSVEHSLYVRLGEWFLDESVGLDRHPTEQKRPIESEVSQEITRAVLQDERIKEVTEVEVKTDLHNRTMQVSFVAKAEDGEVVEIELDRQYRF